MALFMIGWQELLPILILAGPVLAAIPVIAGLWVYYDAKARQNPSAVIWAITAVLWWFLVLPIYLIVRPDFRTEQH